MDQTRQIYHHVLDAGDTDVRHSIILHLSRVGNNTACEIPVEVRNDPFRFHLDSLNGDRNCYTQSNCTLILDRLHEQLDHALSNIDI